MTSTIFFHYTGFVLTDVGRGGGGGGELKCYDPTLKKRQLCNEQYQ